MTFRTAEQLLRPSTVVPDSLSVPVSTFHMHTYYRMIISMPRWFDEKGGKALVYELKGHTGKSTSARIRRSEACGKQREEPRAG